LALCAQSVALQEVPSPTQMLRKVTAAYQNLRSLSFTLQSYDSLRKPDQRLRTIKFRYLSPNKFSLQYVSEKPNRGGLIVSDGRFIWEYYEDSNSYRKSDAVPSFQDWRASRQLGFAGSALGNPAFAEQLLRFYVNPELQLTPVEKDGARCIKLKMSAVNNRKRVMTLFIDEKTLLLRSAESATDGDPNECYSEKYTDIVVAPPLTPADFEFKPPPGSVEEKAPPKIELLPVGSKAPDFAAKSTQDKEIKLSHYRGKPVLLYFFALSAPNAKAQLERIAQLPATYGKQKLALITIECWSQPAAVKGYADKRKAPFPVVSDLGRDIQRKFGVEGLPALILLDKSGIVRFAESGLEQETLQALGMLFSKL
jgi:peroxiredoxin/outer membrane lipoprotein-sorting protein